MIPLLLFAVALALLVSPPAQAEVQAAPVLDRAAEVRDYWTEERMREAEPVGPGLSESANDPGPFSRPTDCIPIVRHCAQEVPDPADPAISTHGKVFFTVTRGASPNDYVCSGTVVNSRNRSVVWTAGHCVYDQDPSQSDEALREPGFVSNWMFAPGYRDGETPYGSWTAKRLATTGPWQETANIKYDLGAAVVRADLEGDRIQQVVGARGIAFDQPRDRVYQAFGYPAIATRPDFTGEREFICEGAPTGSDDPGTAGPDTLAIKCDMTGGSSGGGWIAGGTLLSVTSYGYSLQLDRLYGPYMSTAARALFRSVRGKPNRKQPGKGKGSGKKNGSKKGK